jgi:hypothetical protein
VSNVTRDQISGCILIAMLYLGGVNANTLREEGESGPPSESSSGPLPTPRTPKPSRAYARLAGSTQKPQTVPRTGKSRACADSTPLRINLSSFNRFGKGRAPRTSPWTEVVHDSKSGCGRSLSKNAKSAFAAPSRQSQGAWLSAGHKRTVCSLVACERRENGAP